MTFSQAGSPLKQSRRSSDSENSESHGNSPPPPLQSSLHHSQISGTRRRHLQTANGRSTQNRHAPSKRPLMSVRERDQRSKRAVPVKEGGRRPTAVVVSSAGDDERTRNRLVMESRKQQETAASLKVRLWQRVNIDTWFICNQAVEFELSAVRLLGGRELWSKILSLHLYYTL